MKIFASLLILLLCFLSACVGLLPYGEINEEFVKTVTNAGRDIPGMLYDPRFFSIRITNNGAWEYTTTDWMAHHVFIFPAEVADLQEHLVMDDEEMQFQLLRKVHRDSQGRPVWFWISIWPKDHVKLPGRLQAYLKAITVHYHDGPSREVIDMQQTVFINTMLPIGEVE